MAATVVSTPDISGYTFYKNKGFDISFSVTTPYPIDTSLYFSNSTFNLRSSTSNGHFISPTGFNAVGAYGILSVDVLSSNPRVVTSATPQSYVSAAGVCTDPSGNLYFAVSSQNKIFKLDLSGAVTTFAGDGTAGDTEGPRLTARFRSPGFVITDGSGTFYVTDSYRVRKIDPTGTVSTIAGTSAQGYVDASGTSARFFTPGPMTFRPNGDLLVTESDSHTIRNVTLPGGGVTTYAGKPGEAGYANGVLSGLTAPATMIRGGGESFYTVYDTSTAGVSWTGTAASSIGSLLTIVSDSSAMILYGGVKSVPTEGPIWYSLPNAFDTITPVTGVPLDRVESIAYNGSNLYVAGGIAPTGNSPLYSSPDGITWTIQNSPTTNVLSRCKAVAYANGLWIAAGGGSNDGTSDASTNFMTSTDGSNWTRRYGSGYTQLYTDILRVTYGNGTWVLGSIASGSGNLMYSTDGAATWTLVVDYGIASYDITGLAYGNGIWVLGSASTASLYTSSNLDVWVPATVPPAFSNTRSLYYSQVSNCFFAGAYTNNLVTSVNGTTWTLQTDAPTGQAMLAFTDVTYPVPVPYGSARMFYPFATLYDPSGTLYIADQYNNRIRSITSNTMSTFAGTGGVSISNGTLATAGVARPSSLARDSAGTIYVGSFERNTLQTIIGSNVSLLAGAEFSPGNVNGAPASARFNGLAALTSFGNILYMSEVFNGDIRTLTTLPDVRPGVDKPSGYTIIATSNYPITLTSRIDPSWTAVGGAISLYKYEPFCNTFATRVPGDTLAYSTSSTELIGYLTGTGTATAAFRATGGATTAYPYSLVVAIQDLSGSDVVDDISASVTINASRLIVTPCNTSFTFYRNEPISPVGFSIVASPASNMYSASTLPTGLTFTRTDTNAFALTGTPLTQTLSSNYMILGQDTSGRTYSTTVSMVVNPERLVIDVTGSPSISNVVSTTAIAPVTLTSRFPPYTTEHSMAYTWSQPPPEGLVFTDCNGIVLTGNTYRPSSSQDASFSLTLSGTITEAQVRRFASNATNPYTISIVGTRTYPLPSLSPSVPTVLSLTMGRVILFDSSVPTPFVGIPVSNWWYSARSYFGSYVSIESIFVSEGFLPDGITSTFSPTLQRLDLSGTPTAVGTYGFTLTARATGGAQTATLPVSITTVKDSITIYPTADGPSSTFIQTRDVSLAKSGIYSLVQYSAYATSSSSNVVTMTATGLPDGVSVVSLGNNQFTLSGRPTTAVGVTTAVLTATAPISGATATKTIQYSVSAERFTFTRDPSANLTFAQNVPASNVQIVARTFSENPVLRYSSGNLPPALTLTNGGLVSGTPEGSVDASFTVTGFTAYTSGSTDVSYTITDDAVLLQPAVYTTVTAPGGNVSIPIAGYSLSALTVSNYRFSNTFPYGLAINPTTGLLSGTLSSSLPADVPFTLLGSAGIVDGSLTGLLHTDNLTVNRAELIEMRADSNLRIYSSDDNGLTWSNRVGLSNRLASHIGTNGSNVYLIPTSTDFVMRSADGVSYVDISLNKTAFDPRMTGIVNKPGTSTWWIGGTLSNAGVRTVYVFKSTDNGLTWNSGTAIPTQQFFTDRAGNPSTYPSSNAYLNGGVELAYKDGVLLLGGNQILRSADDGVTWTVGSSLLIEIASFSVDHETVWVAAGTSRYPSTNPTPPVWLGDATTLVYSTDAGLTWTPGSGSTFKTRAYQVVYGLGAWFAIGVFFTGSVAEYQAKYSFDGVTWTHLPVGTIVDFSGSVSAPGPRTIGFDETEWKIFGNDSGTLTLYSHPYNTPLTSGWTSLNVTSQFVGLSSGSRFYSYAAQTIDPGADITTLSFPIPNTGPAFVSPAQSTYVVWQYMPVPPIVFSAPGAVGYFVSALPVGLTWDGTTRTVSGACMRTGTQTFTVYAKNSGITAFVVTLIVEVPRVIRNQTSAGAYTSLVRQYTEVNAAQKARDTRALPSESRTLGEFASPYPPSVVTPSNCPC